MGVRTYDSAAPAPPRARAFRPGLVPVLFVVLIALALLLANGRVVGDPEASGAAGWLLRGAILLAGQAVQLDAAGEALVGKALAALFAALAAGALFAAVVRRHGTVDARWAGLLLALGTSLAAAAQAWSGEAAATWAVAMAVLLFVRSDEEDDAGPAVRAGLFLGTAVALQPSTAALALVLAGAILVRWRGRGLLVLAWAAPALLLGLAGLTVSPSGSPRPSPEALAFPASPAAAALALVASPAKGALVFAPVVLVGLAGLLKALQGSRRLWDQPSRSRLLPIACGLAAVAHLAALAVAGGWAAGDFWGPRWVAPAWPLLLLFVPEGFALLKIGASLIALASMAVQALGVLSYDGRWDRLYRRGAGDLPAVTWDVDKSPIAFQLRERVVRVGRPGLEGRRVVVREGVVMAPGATGSFLSFARLPPRPTGVESTMSGVRLEGGARVSAGHLELHAAGDGVGFRVPEGARPRRLELRVVGRGQGTLGVGESQLGKDTRWHDQPVSGSFRIRRPYHFRESGGPDVRVSLRSGGPIAIESVALVPPTEPDNVLRLP